MKIKKKLTQSDLYHEISLLLKDSQVKVIQTINYAMVYTYFEIGKRIVEHEQKGKFRAQYAKETIVKLSKKLTKEFGKGYSTDNLENMRKFYIAYRNPISETLSRKSKPTINSAKQISETVSRKSSKPLFGLSWSHYTKLLRIENINERSFYEIESIEQHWSVRELQRQFDSALYERLVLSKNKKKVKELGTKGHLIVKPEDIIKEPFVLEFLGLKPEYAYSEDELEGAIIRKLQGFLLELGKGFTFVSRQQRISFDERHFYIDLVFYNRMLKCFVLIDLKIGDLKHQDIGQMQMYINYYDRKIKLAEENKTIGIILCKDKSDVMIEYTLPPNFKQIFTNKYQFILPKKEDLKKLLIS